MVFPVFLGRHWIPESRYSRPGMALRSASSLALWPNMFFLASSSSGSCSNLPTASPRSEEHTSELQSQSNLVCRLLLEKKNQLNRKRTRLNSSHSQISYAVFCLKQNRTNLNSRHWRM